MKKEETFNKMFFMLIFAILFEPILCIKYNLTNYIYIFGAVFSLLSILFITYKKNSKIDTNIFVLLALRIELLLPTLLYPGGDIMKWGYMSLIMISLFLILNYTCKIDYRKTILMANKLFGILLILNLLSYIFFPNGVYYDSTSYQSLYLLGIRTRFTDYAYVGLILTELNYALKNCSKKIYLLSSIICILNVVLPKISTAIVAIIIFYSLKIIFSKQKHKTLLTYKNVLITSWGTNFLIIFFNIQMILNWLFVKFFNKTANLTGRTEIWEIAWNTLLQKPILGYGVRNDGSFVYVRGKMWQAHNQIIQLLYDGGIIGMLLFIIMLFIFGKNLKFNGDNNDKLKQIIIFGLGGFFIIMITEISSYYLPIYLLLFLGYFIKYNREENTK